MPAKRTFIIAEAGVNHNGSVERAIELVRVAARAGADAVKFQTFNSAALAAASAPQAEYQKRAAEHTDESQLEMLRRLEIAADGFKAIARACEEHRIEFMSTAFDLESLALLTTEIGVKRLKSPSGELTNGPYLLALARAGLPILLSTGMGTFDEVEAALDVLAFGMTRESVPANLAEVRGASRAAREILSERVVILHCTSAYPAPVQDVNLAAMATLRARFGLPVGYSDHTLGMSVSTAAVAMGATAIEKHFTLDRSLPGPDHAASLEPGELAALVRMIREVDEASGDGVKRLTESERNTAAVARRGMVAARDIAAGAPIAAADLSLLRPAVGPSPMFYWDVIGRPSPRQYRKGEPIDIPAT